MGTDTQIKPPEGFELDSPSIKPPPGFQIDFDPVGLVKSHISDPMPEMYQPHNMGNETLKRAIVLSNTLGIPFRDAYKREEEFSKKLSSIDPSWMKTATSSFKRGIGNTYVSYGRALELSGIGDFAGFIPYGQGLQQKYAPPLKPSEFTFDKALDPDYWATTPVESIPFTLSLIPAALIAAYGGAAAAGTVGLGAFGSLVIGSIGAGVVSRTMESALEASNTYDEAIARGDSEEGARSRADYTFKHNLVELTGSDIAQFLLAFTPLSKFGVTGPLTKRLAATALVKVPTIAAMEAGEEVWQERVQQMARGEKPSLTSEMKESALIGGIFGLGLGGTGSVYTALTGAVVSTMDPKIKQTFDEAKAAQIALGATEYEATLAALDIVADTPEGKAHIEKVVGEIKDMAEGTITEKIGEIEKEVGEAEEELFTDEDIKAITEEGRDAIDVLSEKLGEIEEVKVEPERITGTAILMNDGRVISSKEFPKSEKGHAGLFYQLSEAEKKNVSDISGYITNKGRYLTDKEARQTLYTESGRKLEGLTDASEIVGKNVEVLGEAKEAKQIISEETYQKAKKSLSSKLGSLHAGVDPTAIADMAVIGAYHIEKGLRTFASWSTAMIKEFGDDIKPYLRKIWRQANDYLEAKVPAKQVKAVVRKATGQTRLSNLIREDVALLAAFKKAEQNARIAYKAGAKDAIEKAKADFRDILLKARIKAEVFGFKEGFKVGSRLTAKHLIQGFKDSQVSIKESREMLIDYINDNLPPELRGNFLNAIIQNMTKKKQASIFLRVDKLSDKLERKDLIKDIAELKKLKGDISLDYQRKINDLIGDIDTKKITKNTLRKLESLKDYIEREGIPSGISTKTLDGLRRLEMKPTSEMTTDELKLLVDTATHLRELGKLKLELKNKYNERLRKVALDRLLSSTYNLDPSLSGEETLTDKIKKGAMFLYMDALQNPRTADMIDGYQNYNGENAKLAKRFIVQETIAITNAKAIINSAVHEMIDAGIQELTEEQQQKIMINIRNQEGAYDQVQTLMDTYGYKEIPVLTPQEFNVIDIIKKHTNQYTDRIAAIYEEKNNAEFPRIENYILPLKYEKEFNIIPDEAVQQTRHRTTQTEQGFTIARKKGVKRVPRVDIYGLFENAINDQQWYINMQPAIEDIKHLILTKEYTDKAGELASNWWKDHLDIVARRGDSATANHTPFSTLLRQFRFNIGKAILGYKLSSIIMQIFALVDAMAYSQSRWGVSATLEIMQKLTKAMVVPKYAQKFIDVSPALQIRKGGEVAIQESLDKIGYLKKSMAKGLIDKFLSSSMSMLMRADVKTAAGVEMGLLSVLEKHGIPNAKAEAEFLMNIVSSSSEITFRPHILGRGEAAKTWFTFQTFFLNRWGIVAHDLISSGVIHGDWKGKYRATLGLAIIVAGAIAEDETRKYMYETISGKKLKDKSSMFEKILFAIPNNIPYFGQILEATINRRSSDIPLVRVVKNLFSGKLLKTFEAVATLEGIPGTAQFFDVIEGIFLGEESKAEKPTVAKPKLSREE